MACGRCRAHKIKCDRSRPTCKNCAQRASQCNYIGERSKRRKLGDVGDESGSFSVPTSYRFVENCISNGRRHRNSSVSTRETFQPLETRDDQGLDEQETQAIASTQDSTDDVASQHQPPINGVHGAAGSSEPPYQNFHSAQGAVEDELPTDSLLDKILGGGDNLDCLKDCNAAVWMRVDDGDEYTGPSSGISTISDLGLKWMQNHLQGPATLSGTVKDIRNGILSHLRQPKCIPPGPWPSPETHTIMKPLPSPEIVRKYFDAYFSELQTIFPVLDQAKFEAQVATNDSEQRSSSSSWKALFFAVLASGCRAALSDETAEAFQESGRESWGYFRNALCYEAKMVHGATDLTAVQAFAVMTVFAQGLSSPQRLEYTVSSTASRLAHSLALHRYPPAEWNLTEAEKSERNRLFWVVYCLDKTIALRCGRPSIIQDDEISCCFPHGVRVLQNEKHGSGGTNHNTDEESQTFDFFLCYTKFARLCGRIAKHLYSAVALSRPSFELTVAANRMLADLEIWRQSIPYNARPGHSCSRFQAVAGVSKTQLLVLHFSYNYALCAVHRRFTPMFLHDDENHQLIERPLLRQMPTTHIEAARSMALFTKHLDVESYAPAWLVFYYPMTALITIFMHIICNPSTACNHNDIALLEVVVGFFGRLEFVTSGEAAFNKTGEFVRQARFFVARSLEAASLNQSSSDENETFSHPSLATLSDGGEASSFQFNATTMHEGDDDYNNLPDIDVRAKGANHGDTAVSIQIVGELDLANEVHGAMIRDTVDDGEDDIATTDRLVQNEQNDMAMASLERAFGVDQPSDHWLDMLMSPRQTDGLESGCTFPNWA